MLQVYTEEVLMQVGKMLISMCVAIVSACSVVIAVARGDENAAPLPSNTNAASRAVTNSTTDEVALPDSPNKASVGARLRRYLSEKRRYLSEKHSVPVRY